jgi:hypothetical protein
MQRGSYCFIAKGDDFEQVRCTNSNHERKVRAGFETKGNVKILTIFLEGVPRLRERY